MNINDAEKLTGIAKKTIRFYEEAGLLSIQREEHTGYRLFTQQDINTLKEIKLFRNMGIPIQDIREIMNRTGSSSEVLIRQIQDLTGQINSLQLKKSLLESFLKNSKLHNNSSELISDLEDIMFCDPAMLRDKLPIIEKNDIVLASMGASPQVNELLQELLPGLPLREEQKKLGSVRIDDIEKAQLVVIRHINK